MCKYLLLVYALISLAAFTCYWFDKQKAKRHRYRFSEFCLLTLGFFGGAAGALAAMKLFRHKTKHLYFWIVNFAGLVWQTLLAMFLFLFDIGLAQRFF